MRMWGINPEKLCRNHLLGEHKEIHMMIGAIRKNKNIQGFLNGLYDLQLIFSRHTDLVLEMRKRGYNHKSEISSEDNKAVQEYILNNYAGWINVEKNKEDLRSKCGKCEV